ncbi:MAG TPA: hypothetical protein DCY79_16075 [Planctomycetaceae bacterium]|nr:hypothetical protein [Blastopirellula sp.]HAY81322.1 hypothetical protein [Planctomycetaceae bacterium]
MAWRNPFPESTFGNMAPPPVHRAPERSTAPLDSDFDGRNRRSIPAWLASAVLHATLLILFLLLYQVSPRGASPETSRTGGIVLVRTDHDHTVFLSEPTTASSQAETASANAAPAIQAALPEINTTPLDLPAALPSQESIGGSHATEILKGTDALLSGSGPGKQLKNYQVETSVFGVQGTGSKFIYVFDRSTSMEGYDGVPLAAAKSQLIRSLNDLQSTNQFQIIFYNANAVPWNPNPSQPPSMMFGDESTKAAAIKFIRGIVGRGNTRHLPALQQALRLAPDVVFFLTDAEYPQMTRAELDKIKKLNRGTSINSIEFGIGPRRTGRNFLTQLASENNGHYTYIDIHRLPTN